MEIKQIMGVCFTVKYNFSFYTLKFHILCFFFFLSEVNSTIDLFLCILIHCVINNDEFKYAFLFICCTNDNT